MNVERDNSDNVVEMASNSGDSKTGERSKSADDKPTRYCELCKMTCNDNLQFASHLVTKRHILKENAIRMQECAIFVKDYPPNTPKAELISFFSVFGKVDKVFVRRFNSTVVFFNKTSVQNVLSRSSIFFKGRKLFIKKNHPPPVIEDVPPKTDEELNAILSSLENTKTFDEQLTTFINQIQMPAQEMYNKCRLLCEHLEMVLSQKFPGCKALQFGSTVTGLAYKGSDVDVYIHVPQHLRPDDDPRRPAKYVYFSKSLLSKNPRFFGHVVGIPKAKTPIVKFLHRPTNINCDFNFKNLLGVCNSGLISYYLSLDQRLRPLMIIIKFWAKVHGLSGCGKISNYALVMLLIFYLQQDPEISLPTVAALQSSLQYANIQEGWNGGFDHNYRPNIPQIKSIPELFAGFVNFYSSFEFPLRVISPYTGQAYLKTDFVKPECLPDIFRRYKEIVTETRALRVDAAMCVQDPFEHDHNITGSATLNVLQSFQEHCSSAAALCAETSADDWNGFLVRLFKEKPAVTEETLKRLRKKAKPTTAQTYEIIIPASASIATVKSEIAADVQDEEQAMRMKWYDRVNELLISILINVLKFEVTVEKCSPEHKAQRKENQVDVHNDVIESLQFHCTGQYCLWMARRKTRRKIDTVLQDAIQNEIKISDYLLNEYKSPTTDPTIIDATLIFHAKRNPTRVALEFKNNNPELKEFQACAEFLRGFIPKLVEKSIRESKNKENLETKPKTDENKPCSVNETVEKEH